ncbi:MAG: NAD(P)-binding protein [Candidatus Latescibacteria bacterium]|nr:NAD(P)-binding protein [Candidatus Latescibacterota bacterium]MBT4138619.1 NAD(P)-binding protein [Candidatus Latescibacterota bacterium]
MKSNINRRNFLKSTLLTSAGICVGTSGAMAQGTGETVLVIGAGISGLATAKKLQSNGFNVTVLEGRDRTGGRIWSSDVLGAKLDLGAAWIHGIDNNPITTLAQEIGAETSVTDFDALYMYDTSGIELEDAEIETVETTFKQVVAQLVAQKPNADSATAMSTAVDQVLAGFDLSDRLKSLVRWYITSEVELELAADLSELSHKHWDEDSKFPGKDVVFPGGYQQLTDNLATGLDIRLSHIVSKIEYTESRVTVTTDQGIFEGDRAVVTLPLGVLKSGSVTFSPELPAEKTGAVSRLEMGTLNKLALKFSDRFWPAEAHRMGVLEDNTDKTFEFWNMTVHNNEPILVALFRGAHARSLEQMAEQDVVALAMANLRSMFGHSIADPTGFAQTKWHSDPFSGGAYVHVPPNAQASDFDLLADPIENRLFFAGEATNDTYWGTVHGAYLSGLREADRIIALGGGVTLLATDFNADGSVNFPDFLQFVQNFGKRTGGVGFDSKFDLNNNGSVDFPDFLQFVQSFGKSG